MRHHSQNYLKKRARKNNTSFVMSKIIDTISQRYFFFTKTTFWQSLSIKSKETQPRKSVNTKDGFVHCENRTVTISDPSPPPPLFTVTRCKFTNKIDFEFLSFRNKRLTCPKIFVYKHLMKLNIRNEKRFLTFSMIHPKAKHVDTLHLHWKRVYAKIWNFWAVLMGALSE